MAQQDIPVIGLDDQVHNLAWARAKYGGNCLSAEEIAGAGYRLVMAQEVTGLMAIHCTVLDANGVGKMGVIVNYLYPEPPSNVDAESTLGGGVAEHTMGPNEAYDPRTAMGPVSWQVRDAPCERVRGLGWLAGTNHDHLDIVLQWSGDADPPDDRPGCWEGFKQWLRSWLFGE